MVIVTLLATFATISYPAGISALEPVMKHAGMVTKQKRMTDNAVRLVPFISKVPF